MKLKNKMWLTKNQKKVLKLLLDNAKLSDTSIANELNISSQAIGRIRKRLEEEMINGYTLELDLNKLEVKNYMTCEIKLTEEGKELGEKKVNEIILQKPEIIYLSPLINNNSKQLKP